MKHLTVKGFWDLYRRLPKDIQTLADKNFDLLKTDPRHRSLRLKKVGDWYSVRVGAHHRALALVDQGALVWFWIGTHADYDALL